MLCYKLDIGLAFVKSGLSGTDIPRGRTRLRLVRPLGMSVPDKPLITQAAADIYNLYDCMLIYARIASSVRRLRALSFKVVLFAFCHLFSHVYLWRKWEEN